MNGDSCEGGSGEGGEKVTRKSGMVDDSGEGGEKVTRKTTKLAPELLSKPKEMEVVLTMHATCTELTMHATCTELTTCLLLPLASAALQRVSAVPR